ncbi:cyclin-dependent kinase inhibitor 1D isoform X1 [Osmerus mordax]|uniref:cyclin-dependent kinase inhibitor 1D isoform X1 n=2 Tax=Osmerus mordax TaxID=8014 RepID=UPI00350FF655
MSDITMATPSSSCPPRVGVGKLRLGPVRRNLFGPVDHLQLQQDFHRLLSVSLELANQRWSYDFHSDQPRAGADVEWEELSCQDVPAFYCSCLVKRGGGARREGVAKGGEGGANGGEGRAMAAVGGARRMTDRLAREESPASTNSGEEYLEVTTRRSYRLQRPERRMAGLKKRHQAAITDFFSVKKRKFLYPKRPASQ